MSETYPESIPTAKAALEEGNRRYVQRITEPVPGRHLNSELLDQLAGKQQPWAVILGCADSRVSPELLFDCVPGELFTVRVAGNIATPTQLGSIDFAVSAFNPKLIVVLGHTRCGAVQAALNNSPVGSVHLTEVIDTIRPAIAHLDGSQDQAEAIDLAASWANVEQSITQLREQSAIVQTAEQEGQVEVLGAVYDLATAQVHFA